MGVDRRRVVREHYAAYNRGDLDGLLQAFAEDALLTTGDPQAEGELGGPYRGREEIRAFFEGLFDLFSDTRIEIADLEATGDQVVASVYTHGRFRESGIEGFHPAVHLLTVSDDGLVTENRMYRQGEAGDAPD